MKKTLQTPYGMIGFSLTRKNVRNIRVRVCGCGEIKVSAPARTTNSYINAFLIRNAQRILKRREEVHQRRENSYPLSYVDGDSFLHLGKRVLLSVKGAEKAAAKFDSRTLILYVPKNKTAKQMFIQWALKTAHIVFPRRICVFAGAFNAGDIKLSVRNMLTRWGSINILKRSISLTVHLLRCETDIIDYVIVHELCHIMHPHHKKAFYSELKRYFPDPHYYDKKLSEYGLVAF